MQQDLIIMDIEKKPEEQPVVKQTKRKGAAHREIDANSTTVNDKGGEKKRKTVDWLGERLVEKLDRDHYMCIICFKRMSRGYASCHCNEDHQNISEEMKPFIVKAYINGKKVNEEVEDSKMGHEDKDKKSILKGGPLTQPPPQLMGDLKEEPTDLLDQKDGKSKKSKT